MIGADIGLGWIDQSGQLHFEVEFYFLTLRSYFLYHFNL